MKGDCRIRLPYAQAKTLFFLVEDARARAARQGYGYVDDELRALHAKLVRALERAGVQIYRDGDPKLGY